MSYDLGLELKAISECSLYNHLNYCILVEFIIIINKLLVYAFSNKKLRQFVGARWSRAPYRSAKAAVQL